MPYDQPKPQTPSEYSMGSTKLMEAMEKLISTRDYQIDVVCLNLGTLVRNCMSNQPVVDAVDWDRRHGAKTEYPAKALFKEAKAEMVKILSDLVQMYTNANLVINPTIITYHADYSKSIPDELYRPPTDSKYYLTGADELVRTQLVNGSRKIAKNQGVTLIELAVNNKFLPWRHIMMELQDLKNNHNVAMISNHPVDYHVGSVSHTFRIARSFTGEIVAYKQLGRIVFKNDLVPFNLYTHAIFGDKEDVKCSLTPGDKNKLLKLAEEEEWSLKTKDYIHDRLYKLGIRIPTHF